MATKVQYEISSDWGLKSVKNRWGHEIAFWDNGFGPLYVYQEACGNFGCVRGVVRAESWETAFECVMDEILKPIHPSEVHEAYGFASRDEMDLKMRIAKESGQDWCPELIEGYRYQGNGTGTGIVAWELSGEALDVLTPELVKELELRLRWERR